MSGGSIASSPWTPTDNPGKPRVSLRYIDWIWHVRDSVTVPEGQGAGEALDRIVPVFETTGTMLARSGETLTFNRKAPAAQDPTAAFEKGTLWIEDSIENTGSGKVLRYHMVSKVLLFCFLLPLLFIGFGQLTLAVGEYQKAAAEAKAKAEGAGKKDEKDKPLPTLNAIDKMLGAPAPEKPKDGEGASRKRKPSATAAYVFAGIFAFLYLVGRFLEPWLVRRLFRRKLGGEV